MSRMGPVQRANVALLWIASAVWAGVFIKQGALETLGQDAHAYWLAFQGGPLYEGRPAGLDAYLYSPVFAQLLTPLGLMPFWSFYTLWVLAGAVALWWLLTPLGRLYAVPAALFCVPDLVIGNIYTFLALMVAVGVHRPAVWVVGVLTKVTPAVGIIWLAARRDWRGLAVAALVTVCTVLVSFVLAPADWREWIDLLLSNRDGDSTFAVRCALAALLAAYAAGCGRVWLLAVAVVVATPVLNAVACFVPLAAIPRLLEWSRADARHDEDAVGEHHGVAH